MLFNRLEPVLWTEEFASGNGLVQQTGENTACLLRKIRSKSDAIS